MTGSLRDLRTTRMRQFFTRAYRTHGPVFVIRVLGSRVVVLAGLQANRYASGPGRRHFGSYKAYKAWGQLDRHVGVARSMISADGEDHAAMRRVEGPAYTRAHFNATLQRSADLIDHVLTAAAEDPARWGP